MTVNETSRRIEDVLAQGDRVRLLGETFIDCKLERRVAGRADVGAPDAHELSRPHGLHVGQEGSVGREMLVCKHVRGYGDIERRRRRFVAQQRLVLAGERPARPARGEVKRLRAPAIGGEDQTVAVRIEKRDGERTVDAFEGVDAASAIELPDELFIVQLRAAAGVAKFPEKLRSVRNCAGEHQRRLVVFA